MNISTDQAIRTDFQGTKYRTSLASQLFATCSVRYSSAARTRRRFGETLPIRCSFKWGRSSTRISYAHSALPRRCGSKKASDRRNLRCLLLAIRDTAARLTNVCFWHEADIRTALVFVPLLAKNGTIERIQLNGTSLSALIPLIFFWHQNLNIGICPKARSHLRQPMSARVGKADTPLTRLFTASDAKRPHPSHRR